MALHDRIEPAKRARQREQAEAFIARVTLAPEPERSGTQDPAQPTAQGTG
ncbi:hypothetical protein [Cyanobium sp. ATX-6F1]